MYKTRIPNKIRDFVENKLNIEIRVAESLNSAKINWLPEEANNIDALYTNGIIFIKKITKYKNIDLNFIILHEAGHAVISLFKDVGLNVNDRDDEIKANAVALAFAVILDLDVSKSLIHNLNRQMLLKENEEIKWEDVSN